MHSPRRRGSDHLYPKIKDPRFHGGDTFINIRYLNVVLALIELI
jgi:hypothetical protein